MFGAARIVMATQVFRQFETVTEIGTDSGRDVLVVKFRDRKHEAVIVLDLVGAETFLQQMVQSAKVYWDHMQARRNPLAVHPSKLIGTPCIHCGNVIARLPHICPPKGAA